MHFIWSDRGVVIVRPKNSQLRQFHPSCMWYLIGGSWIWSARWFGIENIIWLQGNGTCVRPCYEFQFDGCIQCMGKIKFGYSYELMFSYYAEFLEHTNHQLVWGSCVRLSRGTCVNYERMACVMRLRNGFYFRILFQCLWDGKREDQVFATWLCIISCQEGRTSLIGT